MHTTHQKILELLNAKYLQYHHPGFIETDPISIPHLFKVKEDIEIAGFLSATIAWGQRKTIVKNARYFMELMDFSPFDFILNAGNKDLLRFEKFVHRTFNGSDSLYFLESLHNIYVNHGGLQSVFESNYHITLSVKSSLAGFRNIFFELPHLKRTCKHVSDVEANAAAKRLNMFLRWMVRSNQGGVDFGLWDGIPASALCVPLDIHTGNVARKLGLLNRMQDDWKAVEELTGNLRLFDPQDPVKYDYALFGMGIYENF